MLCWAHRAIRMLWAQARFRGGESEYALTIRPLDSHWENLSLWANHVAEKYQQGLAKAKPDEPIDLTVEEVMLLNEMYGDPQESGGK